MSVDKPSCEFKPRFVAERAAFDRHEKTLLDILRKVHAGGPKSEPFDADEAWNNLGNAALWRFQREISKGETILPARRVERLRDLAKALERARHEAHKAMQNDVGAALFWGWHAEAKEGLLEHLSSFSLADKIEEIVARLAHLEAAARRAARDVTTKAGPPRGPGILPQEDIIALAGVYQSSTGKKPIMGAGPFAQFVEAFLTAMGRGDEIANDYVVEALKYARKQERKTTAHLHPSTNSRRRE